MLKTPSLRCRIEKDNSGMDSKSGKLFVENYSGKTRQDCETGSDPGERRGRNGIPWVMFDDLNMMEPENEPPIG